MQRLLVLSSTLFAVVGCGARTPMTDCPPGSEQCGCVAGTCNPGLVCVAEVCARPGSVPTAGGVGAGGQGGSVGLVAGGGMAGGLTSSNGGRGGAGGVVGSGGCAVSGSWVVGGGLVVVGCAPTGGQVASGGVSGRGGAGGVVGSGGCAVSGSWVVGGGLVVVGCAPTGGQVASGGVSGRGGRGGAGGVVGGGGVGGGRGGAGGSTAIIGFMNGKATGFVDGWGWVTLGAKDALGSPTCLGAPITATAPCTTLTTWSSTSNLCIQGLIPELPTNPTVADENDNWGILIAVDCHDPPAPLGRSFQSISIFLSGTPTTGLRAVAHRTGDPDATRYCANVTPATAVAFTAFNTACRDGSGVSLTLADVANLDWIGVQIPPGSSAIKTNLCLDGFFLLP